MRKTSVFFIIILDTVLAGCTLDEPKAIGDRCDGVSFIWPDESGEVINSGDSTTYDYYLNNKICPPDKPYCLTKKGVVQRGVIDENGEYQGDIVIPDESYCSDRRESCPKDSHLVADGAVSYCEHDSALHCGSVENNCVDPTKGVESASCKDGQCEVIRCLQGFTLIDGACLSGVQCCGDFCKNCTLSSHAHPVCSTADYQTFDCGTECPLGDMIECFGVCISPMTNLAYCGVTAQEDGNCEMHYCPDMEGWRNGSCTAGVCQVNECILGYHIIAKDDGSHYCEADTTEVCGTKRADCNGVDNAVEVACELGQCVVKSCEDGYTLYNNECIMHTGKTCGDITCGPHMKCDETSVTCVCESGYTDCNGECYDLSSSSQHCGDCKNICTTDKYSHSTELACVNSECVASACEDGYHLELGRCASNTCIEGETDCIHSNGLGMWKTCTNGEWGPFEPCDNVSCNNDVEKCGICVNGTKHCEDRMLLTCANGRWQNAVECDAALVCSENSCVACSADSHVYGNICEKHDLNNCNAHGSKCDASVQSNGTAFNCEDGTCKATACASGYHLYNGGCEKDDVNNCAAHGKKCDAGVYPGGTGFNCNTGTCNVTSCGSAYHLYGNSCEKNDENNCGLHGTKCNASVIPNGTKFSCDTGVCTVTGCTGGYQVKNNGCAVCNANREVYVARDTKADNGVTIPMDSKITVHYKRKDGNKTDPYGRQKYKVLFSYSPEGQFGGVPTVASMSNVWMPADYVNILTEVKVDSRVDNDSPNFSTLKAGCKYLDYDYATVYGAGGCTDTDGRIEYCSYGICCKDGCWGWFSNAQRSHFGAFVNDLSKFPEC